MKILAIRLKNLASLAGPFEIDFTCEPLASPSPDSTRHRWTLNKNKKGTIGSWVLNWNGASAAFHMVSTARQRHEPADTGP